MRYIEYGGIRVGSDDNDSFETLFNQIKRIIKYDDNVVVKKQKKEIKELKEKLKKLGGR